MSDRNAGRNPARWAQSNNNNNNALDDSSSSSDEVDSNNNHNNNNNNNTRSLRRPPPPPSTHLARGVTTGSYNDDDFSWVGPGQLQRTESPRLFTRKGNNHDHDDNHHNSHSNLSPPRSRNLSPPRSHSNLTPPRSRPPLGVGQPLRPDSMRQQQQQRGKGLGLGMGNNDRMGMGNNDRMGMGMGMGNNDRTMDSRSTEFASQTTFRPPRTLQVRQSSQEHLLGCGGSSSSSRGGPGSGGRGGGRGPGMGSGMGSGGGSGRGRGMGRSDQSLRDMFSSAKPKMVKTTATRGGFLLSAGGIEEEGTEDDDMEEEGGQGQHQQQQKQRYTGKEQQQRAGRGGGRGGMSGRGRVLSRSTVATRNVREVKLVELAQAFELGVKVQRRAGLDIDAFIGSDAVDWIMTAEFASNRGDAEALGRALMTEINLFQHVPRGMEFLDDYRFYSFTDPQDRTYPEGFAPKTGVVRQSTRTIDDIARLFRDGIKSGTHYYRNVIYHSAFAGDKAVDWMVDSSLANSRREACQLGHRLQESGLFRHLHLENENKQGFKDDRVFYRFADEVVNPLHEKPVKGDSFQPSSTARDWQPPLPIPLGESSQDERQQLEMLIETPSARNRTSIHLPGRPQATSSTIHMPQQEEPAFHAPEHLPSMHPPDMLDNMERSIIDTLGGASEGGFGDFVVTREERLVYHGYRLRHWASSFRRMDPRQQILDFFNTVKQVRDKTGVEKERTKSLVMQLYTKGFPLSQRLFNTAKASLFTIFRPTSTDAIRKMMMGQAVGKGLDIKGKSAKRGKLSAFVPFLQISQNNHKDKIRTLPPDENIRIFFATLFARDSATDVLEAVGEEMMQSVEEAKNMLQRIVELADEGSGSADAESKWTEVQKALGCEMDNPTIHFLDEYAPHCYGLEIPVRLFWEAFINRQDISRTKGSQYDTGRPSIPAFQDKNFGALRALPTDGSPRAVLWQNSDEGDSSMNPLELLMAYEEHGQVFPVVSDFDAFLLGSQRISFHQQLPPDQVEILSWCIDRIHDILATPGPESWTSRWLEKLENPWEGEDIHPTFPRFGFGDPISYTIMEEAANTLTSGKTRNGAVRHGAECFNYYFPQDLDDEFLVISEDLPGTDHWTYMNAQEVQDFLSARIRDGYTFPLNPKWMLCDGWGKIYDELMASDRAEVKESLNTWFPPDSGIREKIADIRKRFPRGFVRQQRTKNLADIDPSILADVLACDASNALPGTSSAAGVAALLSTLGPGHEEELIVNAASALASFVHQSPLTNERAKELGKAMDKMLFCLDVYLPNRSIQLNILSVLQSLSMVDLKSVTGNGQEYRDVSLLYVIKNTLAVHDSDERIVEHACRVLKVVASEIHPNDIDDTRAELGPVLLQVLKKHIRQEEIQKLGLEAFCLLCNRNCYFNSMLINSDGTEMVVRSMKHHNDSSEIQGRGCAILTQLSLYADGRNMIGDRGAIEILIKAMVMHPESTTVQNEALTCLKNLATVAKNKPILSNVGAEDVVLYSIWINLADAEVVGNAFKALNNIVSDPGNRTVAKMRALTLHIVLVAMQRYQMDGNIQRVAVFLLKSYSFLPANVRLMAESLDTLLPVLFAAAANFPDSCGGMVECITDMVMV